jgi:uracil-DNA glycosylase family 4
VSFEPQGEQAQFELRHWDGSSPPEGYDDEDTDVLLPADPNWTQAPSKRRKWARLLDVYEGIEEDPFWDYLRQPGIRLVRGDGPQSADAKIMVIGEAPGARENGEGRPFVGQSGAILDQLIDLMAGREGSRSKVFVTNVVKYRPPGNATPNIAAILHAKDALRQEWSIVRPTLTIAVGSPAHTAVHPKAGLMSLSQCRASGGAPYEYPRKRDSDPKRYCASIYHPAYGLRAGKRIMDIIEKDWDRLGDWIREECPDVLEP